MSTKLGGSAVKQFHRRAGGAGLSVRPAEQDEWVEHHRAYSFISWRYTQVWMLEFRFLNGNRLALGYPYLSSLAFDAAGSITLEFTGRVVTLEGFNLEPVFDGLREHRVGYVQELDPDRERPREGEAFIYAIRITEAE